MESLPLINNIYCMAIQRESNIIALLPKLDNSINDRIQYLY